MLQAAGGVVWRVTTRRHIEILLVHRPRRGDWSLPKGKRERGESALDCALREVHEETGLACVAGDELPAAMYRDRKGRVRMVRYWAMQARYGSFRENDEVDEVRWLRIDQVAEVLTYEHDVLVIGALRVPCDASV
jgi:8-oxo-dGTP pyrophosphatase MutT (NUDIX family)